MFTVFAKTELQAGKIILVEPCASSFAICQANLALHEIRCLPYGKATERSQDDDCVYCYNLANDNKGGQREMIVYPWLPSHSLFSEFTHLHNSYLNEEHFLNKDASGYLVRGEKREMVNCVRLSDLLSPKDKIGLLKIDAEGAEARVLEGLDENDFKRIQQMAV